MNIYIMFNSHFNFLYIYLMLNSSFSTIQVHVNLSSSHCIASRIFIIVNEACLTSPRMIFYSLDKRYEPTQVHNFTFLSQRFHICFNTTASFHTDISVIESSSILWPTDHFQDISAFPLFCTSPFNRNLLYIDSILCKKRLALGRSVTIILAWLIRNY